MLLWRLRAGRDSLFISVHDTNVDFGSEVQQQELNTDLQLGIKPLSGGMEGDQWLPAGLIKNPSIF